MEGKKEGVKGKRAERDCMDTGRQEGRKAGRQDGRAAGRQDGRTAGRKEYIHLLVGACHCGIWLSRKKEGRNGRKKGRKDGRRKDFC